MSTRADDHAFPLTINPGRGDEWVNGLTKREDFAKAALIGLLANGPDLQAEQFLGRKAVRLADALIAALNEEPPS